MIWHYNSITTTLLHIITIVITNYYNVITVFLRIFTIVITSLWPVITIVITLLLLVITVKWRIITHYYGKNGSIITVIMSSLLLIITRSIMGNNGFHYYPLLTSPTCRFWFSKEWFEKWFLSTLLISSPCLKQVWITVWPGPWGYYSTGISGKSIFLT